MKFILGKKLHMTQIFKDDGTLIPVTVVAAGPCYVTQIKTKEKDAYPALQFGFDETSPKRLTKPEHNHLKPSRVFVKKLRECRYEENSASSTPVVGDTITVALFKEGDVVCVTGTSKGKGYQGVVRRHGFHGSPASHGHKDQLRKSGSIGATNPQRTVKGRRMAGHMGSETVTIKNLRIIKIDPQENLLYVLGAIPGARGTLLKIHSV